MKSSLIFTLMLVFCGITTISSKKLTDVQLKKIYNSTVDMEEFVDNVFTLPAPQQMYVYEYLQDLVKNLEKDSKMKKFVDDSLKLLQKKVDDFNEEKKLEKVPVKRFIQKRINAQLKAPSKKPDTDKMANKPPPSLGKSSIVEKPAKPQTIPAKSNELKTVDPKAAPKITETPLKLNQVNNSQNSYLMNAGTLSVSRISSNIDKKDPGEKKSLPKLKSEVSELMKNPSSSKENAISTTSSSTPMVNGKKPLSSSNSLQIQQKVQPPMSTNPLNFILMFDKPDSENLKKPSLKPDPEPTKPVIQSSQKSDENSSKPPSLAKKQINKTKSLPSINATETPQKIQTPLQATPAPSSNLSKPKPKSFQNEVKQPKPVENLIPAKKLKTKAQPQDDKSSLAKSPSLKSPKSSLKNQKASSAAAVDGIMSFSV